MYVFNSLSLSRYSAKRLNFSKAIFVVFFILLFFSYIPQAFASTTSGTINTSNKYAWGENIGWVDFNATSSAVTVTDSELTGYAYGENIGWISLNCSNTSSCGTVDYKVTNNAEGTLGGYAYSENAGWINFAPAGSGVNIDSSGVFSGYAYGENIGWINFNADVNNTYPVTTDWRKASLRIVTPPATSGGSVGRTGGSSGGGSIVVPLTPITTSTSTPSSLCPIGYTCAPSQGISIKPNTPHYTFKYDLSIGAKSLDVKYLQTFLNSHSFLVSKTGAGSLGKETSYFGSATRNTLAKFQKANNIKPAVGYLGPITRGFINNMQ